MAEKKEETDEEKWERKVREAREAAHLDEPVKLGATRKETATRSSGEKAVQTTAKKK